MKNDLGSRSIGFARAHLAHLAPLAWLVGAGLAGAWLVGACLAGAWLVGCGAGTKAPAAPAQGTSETPVPAATGTDAPSSTTSAPAGGDNGSATPGGAGGSAGTSGTGGAASAPAGGSSASGGAPSGGAARGGASGGGATNSGAGDGAAGGEHDECSKAAVPYEEKVRPLFNDCYREGKKKNPDLQGSIRITVAVNMTGKVNSVVPAPSELGESVVSCMVKAVKSHPFDGAACKGKTLMVGKTFGKP